MNQSNSDKNLTVPLGDRLLAIVDILSNPDDYASTGKFNGYPDASTVRADYRRTLRAVLADQDENPDSLRAEAHRHYERTRNMSDDFAIEQAEGFAQRVKDLIEKISPAVAAKKAEEKTE